MSGKRRRNRSGIAFKLRKAQRQPNLLPIEELRGGYTPALQEVLARLGEILGKVNVVEMVTATNHDAERDKWLEEARLGHFHIPELQYNHDLLWQVSQLRKALLSVEMQMVDVSAELSQTEVGHVLDQLTQFRLRDALAVIDLADAMLRGSGLTAANKITYLYGMPSSKVVEQALQTIEDRRAGHLITSDQPPILTDAGWDRLTRTKLTAYHVSEIFHWAAKQYGFAGKRPILVSDQVTAVDVRDVSSRGPVVLIPANYTTTALDVIPLALHEVGAHWRDSENMQTLLGPLGAGSLKPVDELLYEGHAVANTIDANLLLRGSHREKRTLYYPIAIDLAYRRHLLFDEAARELYKIIRLDGKTEEEALCDTWQVTYRVHRGNPQLRSHNDYAYTKDRAYFGGQVLAQELREADLGYVLEYGTLTLSDVTALARVFRLQPAGGMPYPDQTDMTKRLCEKLLTECP